MTASPSSPAPPTGKHPKRRYKNYLLDPKFQLKYTAMVVGVTVIVAAVLGFFAYDYSRGQTEMLNIKQMEAKLESGGDVTDEFVRDMERYAEEEDRKVLLRILAGILFMALALGFTGIVITHRLVGPAYRLQRGLREVRDGMLEVRGRLRKGDELQDLFDAYEDMVVTLRTRRRGEAGRLETAIASLHGSANPEVVADLNELLSDILKPLGDGDDDRGGGSMVPRTPPASS